MHLRDGFVAGAMLFIRCKGGVSHNPASVMSEDAVFAARAMTTFVESREGEPSR